MWMGEVELEDGRRPTWLLYGARDGEDDLLGQALEAAIARDERESQLGLDVPPL
jgi:hypothetical protein